MYSMGTFWGFQKSQILLSKLSRGRIVLVYQGDKVQKTKHLWFGDSFALRLSVFLPLFPHTILLSGVHTQPVHTVVSGRGGSVANNRCITFFFFGIQRILKYNKRNYFLPDKQKGDCCYVMNWNFPVFLSMQLWGGIKKAAAASVVSTEICLQSRGWSHEWRMLDETFFKSWS